MRLSPKSTQARKGNRRKGQKAISLYASIQKRRGKRYHAKKIRHLLFFLGIFLVLLGLAVVGGNWMLNWIFFKNPRYALTHVEVEAQGRLKKEQILLWANIPAEANVLALDLKSIQKHLETQSSVQTAEVKRVLPDRLIIRVTERRPLARIITKNILDESEDFYYTIDQEGLIMKPRPGEDFHHLPAIYGINPAKLVLGERVDLGEVYSAIYLLSLMEGRMDRTDFQLQSIDLSRSNFLEVSLENGGKVRFSASSSQLKMQLERFEKILNYCEEANRKLMRTDLTVQRNVPVTFFPIES